MDPNNQDPAQQPGWGAPQEPQQPQQPAPWDAAPQPQPQPQPQAPWSAPQQAQQQAPWNAPQPQPQPGWDAQQPQQPNWGTPPQGAPQGAAAWGVQPVKSGKSRRIIGIVVGIAIVVIVAVVASALLNHGGTGNVYFSKTAFDSSSKVCSFSQPITTASASDAIYVIADFKDTVPANSQFSIEAFKDNVSQGTSSLSIANDFNCYEEQEAVGPLAAGTWRFVFTYNGKTEADGTITITP